MNFKITSALIVSALFASTCFASFPFGTLRDDGPVGKSTYCAASTPEEVDQCRNGELILFAPDMFGNEQLPLVFIAQYCDTEKPVFFNKSGVVCTKVAPRQTYQPKADTAQSTGKP